MLRRIFSVMSFFLSFFVVELLLSMYSPVFANNACEEIFQNSKDIVCSDQELVHFSEKLQIISAVIGRNDRLKNWSMEVEEKCKGTDYPKYASDASIMCFLMEARSEIVSASLSDVKRIEPVIRQNFSGYDIYSDLKTYYGKTIIYEKSNIADVLENRFGDIVFRIEVYLRGEGGVSGNGGSVSYINYDVFGRKFITEDVFSKSKGWKSVRKFINAKIVIDKYKSLYVDNPYYAMDCSNPLQTRIVVYNDSEKEYENFLWMVSRVFVPAGALVGGDGCGDAGLRRNIAYSTIQYIQLKDGSLLAWTLHGVSEVIRFSDSLGYKYTPKHLKIFDKQGWTEFLNQNQVDDDLNAGAVQDALLRSFHSKDVGGQQ